MKDGWRKAVVAAAAVAVGVAAEVVAHDAGAVRSWELDLAVGLGLVACGIVLGSTRSGSYLCAAGFAWFVGNFAAAGASAVSWVGEHGAYLHRALLAQAVLAFPRGRLSSPGRVVVAAAYVAALWPALTSREGVWVLVAGAVVAAAAARRDRRALPPALAFAGTVGGVALVRLVATAPDEQLLDLWYDIGLLLTGALLVLVAHRAVFDVADRVVELGETSGVREALRQVLADDAVANDPKVAAAVLRALDLTNEHARLQDDLLEQVSQLRASRRRTALARGRQRALLARELRDRVDWRLAEIETTLRLARPGSDDVGAAVSRAQAHARQARTAIAALTAGLQPPTLTRSGLAAALESLAERSPVPVLLRADDRRYDAAVEHAAYHVCSEALANVAKHSRASTVRVCAAAADDRLGLEIEDDGRGGADDRGRGMRGMRERVEELGGRLDVESGSDVGTRIVAEIPLRADGDSLPAAAGPVGVGAAW
jgi:signal transduction histidine kinase